MKCTVGNWFLFCLCITLLLSCDTSNHETTDVKIMYTDDLGRKIRLPKKVRKVVSLAPSITEMMFALDGDSMLVARTQGCNFPEEVERLPIVNTYPLDIETIVMLQPDVVLSVDGIINLNQVRKLEELGVQVFFQRYETLADIDRSLLTIGTIIGKEVRASFLVDSLHKALKEHTVEEEQPLSVLALTWMDPIFVYGENTPFSDKIALAGGVNAIHELFSSPYPEVSREYLLKLNPDVILGYDFDRLDSTFFTMYPELKKTTAYQRKQIFEVDDDLMSRPSARYVESVIELKNVLSKCE